MDLAEEVERRLAEIFAIVERIEEERLDEMERAGERPARKPKSKQHQPTANQPRSGCHESWSNDFISPVSFFIGATRKTRKRKYQSESQARRTVG